MGADVSAKAVFQTQKIHRTYRPIRGQVRSHTVRLTPERTCPRTAGNRQQNLPPRFARHRRGGLFRAASQPIAAVVTS
ncbi:hypothetical protein XJ28_22165 [Pseudomonas syringae pv. tomato]|nr:hypothetical protein XJ28_22165 [Pseudomonas syringae pv. tomato]